MPSAALNRRQESWTRYWAGGAVHSCGTSYGEYYGGAIASFWRKVHDDTPAGSRLLDLATGSGAIPRLWRSWRSADTWDAVDLAATVPPWATEAGAGMRFHAAVRAESLPFPAAGFDLVTSQYGLEYCDLTLAVPEILRVRAPGGHVALVLHHAQSRPVSLARTELSHLDWVLGPDGLIAACADMIGLAAQANTPQGRERLARDPAAEAARLRFNAAQVALRERTIAGDGSDVLGEIRDMVATLLQIAMRQSASHAHSEMESWMCTLTDHRLRLEELCTHALDRAAAQALAAQLASAALGTDLGTLEEGQHLMGWALRAGPR
jgi:SAM-dependent methyltransferase